MLDLWWSVDARTSAGPCRGSPRSSAMMAVRAVRYGLLLGERACSGSSPALPAGTWTRGRPPPFDRVTGHGRSLRKFKKKKNGPR